MLTSKIGALEVWEVQSLIEQEKYKLSAVREETQHAEREVAILIGADRTPIASVFRNLRRAVAFFRHVLTVS